MDIIKFKRKMVSELSEYGKVKDSTIVVNSDHRSDISIIYEYNGWNTPFEIQFDMITEPMLNCAQTSIFLYVADGKWTTDAYHLINNFNLDWLSDKCMLLNDAAIFTTQLGDLFFDDELTKFNTHELILIIKRDLEFAKDLFDKYEFIEKQKHENIKYTTHQLLNGEINIPDIDGVYILHNQTNNQYYVGQSTHVISRLKQHFLGNGGNADVYADYKYGAPFDIEIHLLPEGETLNHLEAHYIAVYNACENGYNKTKGNSNQ